MQASFYSSLGSRERTEPLKRGNGSHDEHPAIVALTLAPHRIANPRPPHSIVPGNAVVLSINEVRISLPFRCRRPFSTERHYPRPLGPARSKGRAAAVVFDGPVRRYWSIRPFTFAEEASDESLCRLVEVAVTETYQRLRQDLVTVAKISKLSASSTVRTPALFSLSNALSRARSSQINPSWRPVSISLYLTQARSGCGMHPILFAIDTVAAHRDGIFFVFEHQSKVRSLTSGEYLLALFMPQSSQDSEPPKIPVRFIFDDLHWIINI